jgi:hypothetical protein
MRFSIHTGTVLGVLLLTVACGSAGAGGGDPEPVEPEPTGGGEVALETIEQASVPGKVGEQVREAVRDSTAWQRVWDDLAGGGAMAGQAPAVDFEREMVLAAAMPTQGCISRVTIRGVTAGSDGLVVDLLEQPPAEGVVCVVSERPFHAARLARHDGPVRWQVETEPLDPSVD